MFNKGWTDDKFQKLNNKYISIISIPNPNINLHKAQNCMTTAFSSSGLLEACEYLNIEGICNFIINTDILCAMVSHKMEKL